MRMLTDLVFALAGTGRRLSVFLLSGIIMTSFANLTRGAIMIDMFRILEAGGPEDVSRATAVLLLNERVWIATGWALLACDALLMAARLAAARALAARGAFSADAVLLGISLQIGFIMIFVLRPGASAATIAFDGAITLASVAAVAWLATSSDAEPA